ncbi:unnamed protein product [Spirodela intermedia]|uniref:Uncharacterized protein n=2 Tax=Spirodela intermedia TaxID=51605 RepID=A0A7I8L9Z4_SPIIN|nr:unnamed protein product [Spirodela intermedia]CAA6669514.1 unnamed protein product [Spirodela intermedia]CAA7406476.1 unnamed protein product [Spirodela intermedia]
MSLVASRLWSKEWHMEEKCCTHIHEEYDHRSTEINLSIKLLVIALEGQEVNSKRLIDINLLDQGSEVIIVGLKREIILFVKEKRLKDLHNVTNVCLINIYGLHSESQEIS